MTANVRTHPFHLVSPSPWPALVSLSALLLTLAAALYFHQHPSAGRMLALGALGLSYSASLWWRDVLRESRQQDHTAPVNHGLRLGMLLFVLTEAMFFAGLLWAFLHAALMPTTSLGMVWPPVGILPVQADSWHARPMVNTWLLLASYFTANQAKHRLGVQDRLGCALYLGATIGLGLVFSYVQALEYSDAAFTISDGAFGSTFYLTTGFHGFHVVVGFLYLAVALATLQDATAGRSVALDLAVLYWHFVDVVWLFLLVLLYFWGSAGAELPSGQPDVEQGRMAEWPKQQRGALCPTPGVVSSSLAPSVLCHPQTPRHWRPGVTPPRKACH